ncbi:MAG: O-antigen ligase family protein, partial [Planctomycetia bacterium]|nr:O-antigen ligase family protein [Planctomycetia bacterium]
MKQKKTPVVPGKIWWKRDGASGNMSDGRRTSRDGIGSWSEGTSSWNGIGEGLGFLCVIGIFLSRFLIPCEFNGESGDGLPWVIVWEVVALVGIFLKFRRMRERSRKNERMDSGTLADSGRAETWGVTEWLITAYFAASTGMILVNLGDGSPRVAVTLCLETVGVWIVFLVFRSLTTRPVIGRLIPAILLSMTFGLATIALYQYFDEMPRARAQYHADPDAALRAAGLWYEPGSTQRNLFAQRLESVEPNGPFALTNSLAGVLVPGLVIGAVLWMTEWTRRKRGRGGPLSTVTVSGIPHERKRLLPWRPGPCISWGGCASRLVVSGWFLVAIFALLLTKSRAGYLALVTGVGMGIVLCAGRRGRKILLGGAVILCALVGIGVMVGGIDREILSEAGKSLGYRLEYWEATASMIADHPLTGVGPGNFQSIYTRYKLPWSS